MASPSASTIVANGYHLLRIKDYSRTKGIPTGGYTESCFFTVGGHRWSIRYYPNGKSMDCADYISFLLVLNTDAGTLVQAQHKFRFAYDVEDDQAPPSFDEPPYLHIHADWSGCGSPEFVKREALEMSKYLKNDSFTIRCDVVVTKFRFRSNDDALHERVVVAEAPPSSDDLHHHLGELLRTGKDTDVAFEVGGEKFTAHRCVLAARSKVFKAGLLGAMKESDTGAVVRIDDMEAQVFEALLFFVYTDSFPEMERKEEEAMCQHLLVAADKYDMERLKQICESKLCKYIDVGTVASILALADQYRCHGLKKACFDFVSFPDNLKAVFVTQGFDHPPDEKNLVDTGCKPQPRYRRVTRGGRRACEPRSYAGTQTRSQHK